MFCLHVHVCTMCISGALGSQRKAWEKLGLELWMTVNYRVGGGNRTQVLYKNKCSSPNLLTKPINLPCIGTALVTV